MSTIESLFTQQILVYRVNRVADSQGGYSEELSHLVTAKAHIRPFTAQEKLAGGFSLSSSVYRVYTLSSVEARPYDRIVIFGDKSLRVISVTDPHFMGHHIEIDAEMVQ